MLEHNYSNQLKPLIEKYAINTETNTLFQDVIDLFSSTPNYQVWAVKVIFNKVIGFEELKQIKKWSDENKSLIKLLSKQNIVAYSTKGNMSVLRKEIANLNAISFVKKMISMFNTEQRHMLESALDMSNINSLNANTNKNFMSWHKVFTKFSKLPNIRKKKFISLCSAYRDVDAMKEGLTKSTEETYMWNKEDFLAFVTNNIDGCEIVYNKDNIVILQVTNFAASRKLCGGGRTGWCITRESRYFEQYVTDEHRKQYFFFNFDKPESDEFAHIGFTVTDKRGITYAHSTKNQNLMGDGIKYRGKYMNIYSALSKFNVNLSEFITLKNLSNYSWNIDDLLKKVKNNGEIEVVYNKNNRVIIKTRSSNVVDFLIGHTMIDSDKRYIQSNNIAYVLLDFNLNYSDSNAIVLMKYCVDDYKIEKLYNLYNIFGCVLTKAEYFASIGLQDNDFTNYDNVNPSILLHKYIDEGDENGAINLISEKKDKIDVNYELNGRFPIYSAVYNGMDNLFREIINNKNFDISIEDGFGENLLTSLLYAYNGSTDENIKERIGNLIKFVIESDKIDLNARNINLDTPVNITAEFVDELWILDILLANDKVDVNVKNDVNRTALTNAIFRNNTEAIKKLLQRSDIVVREEDFNLANANNIDLKSMLKNRVTVTEEVVGSKAKVINDVFKKVMSL